MKAENGAYYPKKGVNHKRFTSFYVNKSRLLEYSFEVQIYFK